MIACVEDIPLPVVPESLPGQLDLFAEPLTDEDIYDLSRRECNRCYAIYEASARCCPGCRCVEFSLIRKPGVEMPATATKQPKAKPQAAGLTVTKTKLPKDRTTKKYKDEFDPMKLDKTAGKAATLAAAEAGNFMLIDVALIDHNPQNARTEAEIEADPATRELADTVAAVGLIQPIIVSPNGNRFTVAAGCRRRVACKLAGLKKVPCIIRKDDDAKVAVEVRVIENLQRKDLTPIQEARDLDELQKVFGIGQIELGKKVGKSQAYVSQRLSLLKLSPYLQQLVADGALTVTQGREIAVLADLPHVVAALDKEFEHRLKNYSDYSGDGKTIDRDNYCYAVGGVIDVHMRPMQPTGTLAPSFHPTAEQTGQLDVRELCLDGETREKWAANKALWDKLQKEAKAAQEAAKEEQAAKPATPATAAPTATPTAAAPAAAAQAAAKAPTEKPAEKPAAKPLSQAEQKERDERNALIYQRRLYRYKIRWLQLALARASTHITQEQQLVIMTAFALYGNDSKRRELFAHAVKEITKTRFVFSFEAVFALDRAKLSKIFANFFDRWCDRPARDVTDDANPGLIEILARELGIDMPKAWKPDADFLEIHTIDQLQELAAEWGLAIDQTVSGKGPTVEYILKKCGKPGAVTFPKCLQKLKPVHLD